MGWFTVNAAPLHLRLGLIARAAPGAASTATRAMAEAVATEARNRVAVRTGATRDSIRVQQTDGPQASVVVGGAGVFLEYGTRHTPARPFLAPAVAAVEQKAQEEARRALGEVFR